MQNFLSSKMETLRDKIRQVFPNNLDFITQGGKTNASSETDLEELKAIFRQFDCDGDGFIDESEMKNFMKKMGHHNVTDEEVRNMFQAADANNDGQISFEEFVEVSKANPLTLSYRTIFRQLDRDGDNEITKSELKDGFANMGQNLSDAEIDTIFRQADSNNDGRISFNEFVVMMNQKK